MKYFKIKCKINYLRLLISISIVSFFIGGLGCTKKTSSEIIIGQFASLTGSEATFGISTDEGVRLAIDEANERGGIKGKKIKLVTLDNQGKPEEAASTVMRLIEQHKAVAIIGEVASPRSLAAAPIAQNKKIPMISPSSTNPKVTEVGDYIFRVCFTDPFQGEVMAKFSLNYLKIKKVAILRDLKSDYSVGLADYFSKKFKELGGEILLDLSYQGGDVDFKAQVTQIKSVRPDAIYIPGYYTEVGLIARQIRELGIKVPLLGGDGWDSVKLVEIAGDAIEGGYFSNHYSAESKNEIVVDFINRYQNKYGKIPDGLAAQGYDAAKILISVLESIDEITPKNIRDGLQAVKDFKGVTGIITIDEHRNVKKSAVVVQIKDKQNKYVTTIDP